MLITKQRIVRPIFFVIDGFVNDNYSESNKFEFICKIIFIIFIQGARLYSRCSTLFKVLDFIQGARLYSRCSTLFKVLDFIQGSRLYSRCSTLLKGLDSTHSIRLYSQHTTLHIARIYLNCSTYIIIYCFIFRCYFLPK